MKLKRVYIEIGNVCNLQCAFCSPSKREKRQMKLCEFEHILKEVKPYCDYIYLHIKGEPLLHPEFDEIMKLCTTYQMNVQLVSNATFLSKHPNLINEPSLRKISFSLHSIPFQPTNAEEYMQPILEFTKKVSQQQKINCELRFWNRTQMDEKSKQCLAILMQDSKLEITSKKLSYKWKNHVYIHFDEEFEWPSQGHDDSSIGFCQGARMMIGILSDGTVVPCCLDSEGSINFGNIFEDSLATLLQSKRFTAMEKGLQERKLIEPLCRHCTYRHRFD